MTDVTAQEVIFVGGPMHGVMYVLEPGITKYEAVARKGENPFDDKYDYHIYRRSDAAIQGLQVWYDTTMPIAKLLDSMMRLCALRFGGTE